MCINKVVNDCFCVFIYTLLSCYLYAVMNYGNENY